MVELGPMMGPRALAAWGTETICHAGTNPGIKVRLTQRALEFGRQFGLEQLQSLLQKEHELNLTGSYRNPLLGTLTYAVPRIQIHELQINDSTVDFAEDVGVRLMVQSARIRLSADWGAQLGAIQDKGSIEVHMRDLAVVAVLGVSVAGSGRPTVWSISCEAHGTNLHLEFHRGHSWLYNMLAPLLQKALSHELNKELCLELRRGVNRLEAALKHMKVSTQLDPFAAIDYSLLGQPVITAEHGDIALKGEFFGVAKYQQRPSSAKPVALPMALPAALPVALAMAQEPMLLLAITDFVANSAAFTYFTTGALRKNISSDMLQERYPDHPMELHLSARRQPLFSCRPDALHGSLFSSAEAFVVLPNATRVPAFLLVGVRLMVQRARIRLSADWGAQLGAIQDKGSIEVHMRDLAVVAVLGVSVAGSGRPTVWSISCEAHGTNLHLEFHRGHSWLYNMLAPLLQKALSHELNKELCLKLRRGVNRLEAALKHMKVSTQLDPFAAINYSLLGQPVITAEHGDIALKGEFFGVAKYQQRPSSAKPVALPVALPAGLPVALAMAQEPMLLLAITDFVANSAAFTYFTTGALRKNISSDMLPRRFPLQLRTKSMGVFSPELQERYPDHPMELHLSARRQPLFSCRPDALHGSLFSSAEAFVVLPNATRVPAFLLNIDANVTGKPTITRNKLGGTVSLKGLSVEKVTSHVGPVEVKRLENLLKFSLWLFGVPQANKRLQAGVPLPTLHGLSLLNPRISLQEGFVLIATDLQYES
ncbi:PREDICTED: bactericidal permeability-increasing protein-like [Calidris pugnax]|uniref:bactericidal permeability-increasing protein-like n=1 Tax=Calidris pugnax TaxID=198806 RepID=UPI00071D6C29|nr:PREDICTED: bactericidal permeability-increasing protein-like [Calidris pugnax]